MAAVFSQDSRFFFPLEYCYFCRNKMIGKYLKLSRVNQWVKNLFVFLPLFFSGKFLEVHLFWESFLAFLIFSATASCIYIINDYSDMEADRLHPEKKNRPLASGAISKPAALGLLGIMALLVLSGLGFAYTVVGLSIWKFAFIILSYFCLNLAYTFRLKHIAIVDVTIIAAGFVLRVLAGGYITGILVSQWALLLTFVLALVLAFGKRRGELINAQISGKSRKALDGYNVQFADIALSISVTLAIVSYLMFTVQPNVQEHFGNRIFYTFIFVVFALMRYLQQTLVYNKTESPTKIVYKDRYIQVTVLLWMASFFFFIYLKSMSL